jgi:hypothetical protein
MNGDSTSIPKDIHIRLLHSKAYRPGTYKKKQAGIISFVFPPKSPLPIPKTPRIPPLLRRTHILIPQRNPHHPLPHLRPLSRNIPTHRLNTSIPTLLPTDPVRPNNLYTLCRIRGTRDSANRCVERKLGVWICERRLGYYGGGGGRSIGLGGGAGVAGDGEFGDGRGVGGVGEVVQEGCVGGGDGGEG